MNQKEARLLIGAEPDAPPAPELSEHLASCADCSRFQREMVTLDANIRRALEGAPVGGAVTVPAASVTPIASARTAKKEKPTNVWSGWALAASVALVSVLVIWALRPCDTLGLVLVALVEYEADSWTR